MPELRVGTLDALLALSDDMVKTVTHVEAVVGKIRRQLAELDRNAAEVRCPGASAARNAPAASRCHGVAPAGRAACRQVASAPRAARAAAWQPAASRGAARRDARQPLAPQP
jgi:hypothetical protein